MTVTEFTPHLRNRIAMAIQESGMSQKEIAERLGVSPQVVSRWVRGHCVPDAFDVCELARVTGCPWLADLRTLPDRRFRSRRWMTVTAGRAA